MKTKRKIALTICALAAIGLCLLLIFSLTGCGLDTGSKVEALSYEDAVQEVEAYYAKIKPTTISARLDTDMNFTTTAALSDLSTFPVTTVGKADVVIEIAADTELSDTSEPDNWANVVATAFNRKGFKLSNGKTVAVSIRQIVAGETVTYMLEGNYRPDAFIPSHAQWGEILASRGFATITLVDRLVGNTAGILMKHDVYDTFIANHGEVTVGNVLNAALNNELVFAVTNPYTSSTGLNMLAQMLYAFDANNPLSDKAVQALVDYQKIAPTAAYSTAVMRESAKKGIVDAMAMEAQAYILNAELRDYVYTPVGFRHDHPVITFDYVSEDKQEALQLFVDYCLEPEQQKLATDRGFNLYDEYAGQDDNLVGGDYLSAQSVWKKNKNGGRPVVAVFVADISGSMNGKRLNALKESLLKTIQYIDSDNYVGLVSYDDQVYINLPVSKFDNKQRAYFSGAVKDLSTNGSTATFSATAVGLKLLLDAKEEVPDAQLMLFVLTDGETNAGYSLRKISPMVVGLKVPVYTIAYETSATGDLITLAGLNEAACINADVEGIVNDLRNLFNVNM
ncbi:MAG: VWA domain-containing protein [Candidatus Saccharibacteria bacterium]|nr:VWA domain-containing protein [Candidatus Saccharibacteria bacterium]